MRWWLQQSGEVPTKRSSPRLKTNNTNNFNKKETKESNFTDYEMDNVNKDQFMKTITFPFFENNPDKTRDWSQYCTVRKPGKGEPKLPTTVIGKNYFPKTGIMKDSYAIKEMKRLGKRDMSKKAVKKMRKEIEFHLAKCRNTIRNWFHQFFIDFSNIEGYRFTGADGIKRKINTKEELDHVVDNFTTKEEVFGFVFIMYFVFDYMPKHTHHIMKYVMIQHSLSYDEQEKMNEMKAVELSKNAKRKKRMTKCCIEKLVSVMLNDVRKSYRTKIAKRYGLSFRFKRENVSELTEYEKRTYNRKPKTLHGWMIKGEFVSTILDITLVVMLKQY